MKKPAIPEVRQTIAIELRRVLDPLKEITEIITAQRVGPIMPLPANATLAQVVMKVNEILDRLQ